VKTTESIIIDGYDLIAESGRYSFPDHVVGQHRLNRGTAEVAVAGTPHTAYEAVKIEHGRQIFPNTISPSCPVVDLSYPVAGMFVDSPAGVYLDLYQGVAQKLIDEQHPNLQARVKALAQSGMAFRREINTDDYITMSEPIEGLNTPQELASLMNGLTRGAFPGMGACRTFFSNSGAEAGEAAIKLSQLHAYKRFLGRWGADVLARVMKDLGIGRVTLFDGEPGTLADPLFEDYPFVLFSCDGAFHGRTMGVLNLTRSKKAQHLPFSKLRWHRHIPFNGKPEDLAGMLDTRPIDKILEAPGGVAGVFAAGKVPVDLAALFAVECYQGEGGYTLADREWLSGIGRICREHGFLLGLDEVQSFGRTGTLFAGEHYAVDPDIVWTSKGAVVGMTMARAELADECHVGWHSNTFGGGKFFDVNMAYATIDTLVNHKDPLFEGRGYLDNSRIKGEYVRMRLADLSARHPDIFPTFSGLGGMWGLTVRHRGEIVSTGWLHGAKLLGCGRRGPLSRLRLLLLTDVLTHEIDQMIGVLDRIFGGVEAAHEGDETIEDDDGPPDPKGT
jgi:4-aminobutyrate aminotransferase-like enzyme